MEDKEGIWSCDFCGADKEWNKECSGCFSKKRPSRKDSQNLKSKYNSQQGNPLSDKRISPDANFVETHQAADNSHNLKESSQ